MDHIGIDLGGRESQVCVRNNADDIVEEARHPTTALGSWLAKRGPARVVLETCTETFRLASIAHQHEHNVRVVAATLVRSLGVGQRGLKNDVRAARTLSEASCRIELPSVHIPTMVSQEVVLPVLEHDVFDATANSGARDQRRHMLQWHA